MRTNSTGGRLSFERRILNSIAELEFDEIAGLLQTAHEFERQRLRRWADAPFSVGLLFLSPSLRTRVGFAQATQRLGGTPIDVHELRSTPDMSAPESFADTLRTLSGMVDVTVVRTRAGVERTTIESAAVGGYVNGGDGLSDHPTQTLIDMFAIERAGGDAAQLRIGLCGDLTMRAARSLIKLFDRMPPRELALIAPSACDDHGVSIGPELESRISRRDEADFSGLDILYMVGLPPGDRPGLQAASERVRFALTAETVGTLAENATVLSPGPVIDEIDSDTRRDGRVQMFRHSDDAVYMRMAILQFVLPAR
jgi:aspartate carbamoyltransferase catalytic subunit